jgi:hypothetical protein
VLRSSIEILAMKGTLQVAELAKCLSELSGAPNFVMRAQEKFGGLKKFLCEFPHIFLFSKEHPNNPHVLLRAVISDEQLSALDRGGAPHIMASLVQATRKVLEVLYFSRLFPFLLLFLLIND